MTEVNYATTDIDKSSLLVICVKAIDEINKHQKEGEIENLQEKMDEYNTKVDFNNKWFGWIPGMKETRIESIEEMREYLDKMQKSCSVFDTWEYRYKYDYGNKWKTRAQELLAVCREPGTSNINVEAETLYSIINWAEQKN